MLMRRLVVVLRSLLALLLPSGAQAWTWPIDGPVLRPFVFGSRPVRGGQHRGIDVGVTVGESVRAPVGGDRLVRGLGADGRARADDPHRRRLLRHARCSSARSPSQRGDAGRGRRARGDGRRERRRRHPRAARPPRRPPDRRRGRVPRPAAFLPGCPRACRPPPRRPRLRRLSRPCPAASLRRRLRARARSGSRAGGGGTRSCAGRGSSVRPPRRRLRPSSSAAPRRRPLRRSRASSPAGSLSGAQWA